MVHRPFIINVTCVGFIVACEYIDTDLYCNLTLLTRFSMKSLSRKIYQIISNEAFSSRSNVRPYKKKFSLSSHPGKTCHAGGPIFLNF